MEAFKKEFVKNKNGIDIVKCCASCRHHDSDGREKVRICKKGHGERALDYLCPKDYDMNPSLDNAGMGSGKIKKPHYLHYIVENIGRLVVGGQNTLNVVREKYRKTYGSEYMD